MTSHYYCIQNNEILAREFRDHWGLDPLASIPDSKHRSFTLASKYDVEIESEMQEVQQCAQQLHENLSSVKNETLLAAAILKLFLQDLVGRGSRQANILDKALDLEHPTTIKVVKRWAKSLAFFLVVMSNIFMVYMCMLYAYSKGSAWQRAFLLNYLFSLLTEILFNNVIEVIIRHVIVPLSIQKEASAAYKAL
jgi:hypothetical protein